MVKIIKDILLMAVLFTAMSKIGETQDPKHDDAGVKLNNGCYSLILLIDKPDGSVEIRTVVDCRGGRPI